MSQFIQKKDPKYLEHKEETAWSMDRFNQYINSNVATQKGLEYDWVNNTLPVIICLYVYNYYSQYNRNNRKEYQEITKYTFQVIYIAVKGTIYRLCSYNYSQWKQQEALKYKKMTL